MHNSLPEWKWFRKLCMLGSRTTRVMKYLGIILMKKNRTCSDTNADGEFSKLHKGKVVTKKC